MSNSAEVDKFTVVLPTRVEFTGNIGFAGDRACYNLRPCRHEHSTTTTKARKGWRRHLSKDTKTLFIKGSERSDELGPEESPIVHSPWPPADSELWNGYQDEITTAAGEVGTSGVYAHNWRRLGTDTATSAKTALETCASCSLVEYNFGKK